MGKFVLNCSVCHYSKTEGSMILFSSETSSDDLNSLEDFIDKFSGSIIYGDEYEPKEQCIKFSVALLKENENNNDDLVMIKEKYRIMDLREHCREFWELAKNFKIYTN